TFSPETIFIDESVADHPLTREVLRQFPDTPVHHQISYEEAVEL
ncbi:MAG TPA: radical SAM protein, partial [Nitrospina sp.]|nr:radical SAM protein [Nitrospina sp.]